MLTICIRYSYSVYMTKGRNTAVVSARLPDELVRRLKAKARSNRVTVSEMIGKLLESGLMSREMIDREVIKARKNVERDQGRLSEGVSIETQEEKKVEYPGTARNAPCPCGALHPDGRPKKYKHCCGG